MPKPLRAPSLASIRKALRAARRHAGASSRRSQPIRLFFVVNTETGKSSVHELGPLGSISSVTHASDVWYGLHVPPRDVEFDIDVEARLVQEGIAQELPAGATIR